MADKPAALILAALGRAAAAPDGLPLFAAKAAPGLFPATQPGKQAAQRCRDEGWLDVRSPAAEPPPADAASNGAAVATKKKTKATPETACITEKGLAWLLDQASPRTVLEDFVRVLEARQAQAADLLAAARRLQSGYDALKANAEAVLARVAPPAAGPDESLLARFLRFRNEAPAAAPAADVGAAVLARLAEWGGGAAEDCPLPELFRQVQAAAPDATVGGFHDALRRLHGDGRVYLHPWTGPLYELPEPPYALLVGHEVAYYASLRQ